MEETELKETNASFAYQTMGSRGTSGGSSKSSSRTSDTDINIMINNIIRQKEQEKNAGTDINDMITNSIRQKEQEKQQFKDEVDIQTIDLGDRTKHKSDIDKYLVQEEETKKNAIRIQLSFEIDSLYNINARFRRKFRRISPYIVITSNCRDAIPAKKDSS